MGAQATEERERRHDPHALPDESPVREVALAPFFMARHEMTKGQWKRLSAGDEPGRFVLGAIHDDPAVPIGHAHPIEMVDWTRCRELLAQHGLRLPTEAQWEYGCRAGTETPWCTGQEAQSLAGFANLIDLASQRRSPGWGRDVEDFDDGFAYLAPAGSYGANPWGLFDVYGNLWEWCEDWYEQVATPKRDGDGASLLETASDRVCRGGSFIVPAIYARSTYRHHFPPGLRSQHLGVRAVRALQE
jgi:formylglycine-generating enzyme required for sulfatase activity